MHPANYDDVRCPVCAFPWEVHPKDCSRHDYRPTVRLDAEGRDASDMPGLWSDEDRFITTEEARCLQSPK